MRKRLLKAFRPSVMAREDASRRRRVRSCPRLEHLESRVVMLTFKVNTTLDTVAVNLRTGKDATGHISLRSAIMAADARGGSNTIKLPGGTYTLTIAGANEDASATGDLDITSNLTIKGSGSNRTIIDGNNLDRVVEILQGQDDHFRRHHPARAGKRWGRRLEQRRPGHAFVGSGHGEPRVGSNGANGAAGSGSHGGNGFDGGNGSDGTAGAGGRDLQRGRVYEPVE